MSTTKDILIRFVGKNLVGGPADAARRDIQSVRQAIGGLVGGPQGKFLGAALTGGSAGLIAGTAAATFAPALSSQVLGGLKSQLDFSEPLAKAFGIVTERSRELAEGMRQATQAFRDATNKLVQGALGPSGKALEETAAGYTIPASFPGSLFGERQGRFSSALSGIAAEREKLAREKEGPRARLAFGNLRAKFTQQELKRFEGTGAFQVASDMFFGSHHAERLREDQLREATERGSQRALDEMNRRSTRIESGEQELNKREAAIRGFSRFEAVGKGLGIRGLLGARDFGGALGNAGGTIFDVFRGAVSGFGEARDLNRATRLGTESQSESLQRELGNLERDRRVGGLTDANYQRRLRQIRMQAIGGLDSSGGEMPSLAGDTTRFLTMGRSTKSAGEEVAELRKELKQAHDKEQKALADLIKAIEKKPSFEFTVE